MANPRPAPPKVQPVRQRLMQGRSQNCPERRSEHRDAGAAATYRSYLSARAGQPLLDLVDRELESWLEHKQAGAWDQLRVNSEPIDLVIPEGASYWENQRRQVQYLTGEIAGGTGLRITMCESGRSDSDPMWTTSVSAFQPADERIEGWVAIDITNDQSRFCATPGIARQILRSVTLMDGVVVVRGGVSRITNAEQLMVLHNALVDGKRRYPIVVAGTGEDTELDSNQFAHKVGEWTKDLAGQGQVVFLTPESTRLFNAHVPRALRTEPWTLRTYLPGLDVDAPQEWSRHRLLSTRSLGTRADDQIRGILTNTARAAAHASTFPEQVDEVAELLRRRLRNSIIASRRLSALATPSAQPQDQRPAPVAMEPAGPSLTESSLAGSLALDLERQVLQQLGLDQLTAVAIEHVVGKLATPDADIDLLNQVIDEQDHELDATRRSLAAQRQQWQDSEDMLSELQRALTDKEGANIALRAENRYLQAKLVKIDPQAAFATPAPFPDVDDFFEIMDRIKELDHIVFTGDEDIVLNLSSGDRNGSEARNAWRALVSLDNYARHHLAGTVNTFKAYTEGAGPDDCVIGAGKCVPTESDTTVRQYGNRRVFRVPREVNGSGEVMMLAHIRLGQSDTRAPRLHYYDDVRKTGKIYVGYIGPHLPNSKTARS